ncbi:MAG: glucokinase [Rhodospirillales bacterium 69-11]|nr:glucokinase [Rhodospirillales bacterium]OJW24898.1 MAG: glucokinase [Rhodospirillales bacterium 69-11]
MLLAGDIGGTKTLLALYTPEGGARHPVAEAEFHSRAYPDLAPMARDFLTRVGKTASHACFDVAGPVIRGRAHLTNLPWNLTEAGLAQEIGLSRVTLLNDLQAVAYAVPHLGPEDLQVLNPGERQEHGPIAVVAPGTGLGEAYLVWDGAHYIACASEGGHASFGPSDDRQAGLRAFLAQRYGVVSVERVCSGMGIANIYDYLRSVEPSAEDPALAERLAAAEDRTPLISAAGLEDMEGTSLAGRTMQMFVTILAEEAANMALKVLATGGVFLAGGIPAHVLPLLTPERFLRDFTNKGRMASLLAGMPVNVVTTRAALLGVAQYGLDHMQD